MITLKQWLELANYKITEGERYLWDCYGTNTFILVSWNGINGRGGYNTDIVFDTKTQTVYEVSVYDFTNERAYRMINPQYADAHVQEASTRSVDMNTAWDNVDYIELDVEEDFTEKATAILSGQDYDTRVMVSLELDHDLELETYRCAHKLDITVNEYMERILRELVDKHQDSIPTLTERTWVLEVQEDDNGDAIIQFPDDAMAAAGWQEGDSISWLSNNDGSYTLTKV